MGRSLGRRLIFLENRLGVDSKLFESDLSKNFFGAAICVYVLGSVKHPRRSRKVVNVYFSKGSFFTFVVVQPTNTNIGYEFTEVEQYEYPEPIL